MKIEESIQVVKRAQAAERKAKRERDEINELARKQRVQIRKLKRFLREALDLVPDTVRADKLFEEADALILGEEL